VLARLDQLQFDLAVPGSLGDHRLVKLDLQLSVPQLGVLVADGRPEAHA
jgi:hypothetical protein